MKVLPLKISYKNYTFIIYLHREEHVYNPSGKKEETVKELLKLLVNLMEGLGDWFIKVKKYRSF